MTSESDLLAQISAYAGAINRHRAQQLGPQNTQAGQKRQRSSYGSRYQWIRPDEEQASKKASKSRNRTLVLNQAGGQDREGGEEYKGFVNRHDRHKQLIASSVYDARAASRAKALEETRARKRKAKEDREQRRKLKQLFVKRIKEGRTVIEVTGASYRISPGANKLELISGNGAPVQGNRRVMISGVQFIQSRNGNLWRAGLVRKRKLSRQKDDCCHYTRTGRCARGLDCRYKHNPDHLTACPRYLQGNCPESDGSCALSHRPTAFNTPHCSHFLNGKCSHDPCRYVHVGLSKDAGPCPRYLKFGYCEQGDRCKSRHLSVRDTMMQKGKRKAANPGAAESSLPQDVPPDEPDESSSSSSSSEEEDEVAVGDEDFESDVLESDSEQQSGFAEQDYVKL